MYISYDRTIVGNMTSTIARINLGLYGFPCELALECSVVDNFTNLRYSVSRSANGVVSINDAFPNNFVRIPDPETKGRLITQAISVPPFGGEIVLFSSLYNGGVPIAREVCTAILRHTEFIIEKIRTNIIDQLSKNIKERAVFYINQLYKQTTTNNINNLLKLNWLFLFEKSNFGNEAVNTVQYVLDHNPIKFHSINESNISINEPTPLSIESPAWRTIRERNEIDRKIKVEKEKGLATERALELLSKVCGKEIADYFAENNRVVFKSNNYNYMLEPRKFIVIYDPSGKKAEICVHTVGFNCHPIDEIVIAYLHIKHKLNVFLKTAVWQHEEKGFIRPTN